MKVNRNKLSRCHFHHTPTGDAERTEYSAIQEEVIRSNGVKDYGPWGEHENVETLFNQTSREIDYSLPASQIENIAKRLGDIRIRDSKNKGIE